MLIAMIALVTLLMVSNIIVDLQGLKTLKYITKPAVMGAVITTLFVVGPPHDQTSRWIILAGLLFSLAGDVFLMFEKDFFIWGLASFLIAHIFYVVAFAQGVAWNNSQLLYLLPFLLVAAGMLKVLWPHLPKKLVIPVIVYATALILMGWFAARRFDVGVFGQTSDVLNLVGALLFLVSDGVLSIQRFIKKKPLFQVIVLSTYFPAQLCFALALII
jgi:uncharacterized membrane protein YhhN